MSVAESADQLDLGSEVVQPKKRPGRPRKNAPNAQKGIVVGVDLGNVTTLVAFLNALLQKIVAPDPEGLLCTPTVIAFQDGDPDKPLFGRAAKSYCKVHPEHCFDFMKRARGHGDVPGIVDKNGRIWSAGELEALFLQWRLKHVEEMTGLPIVGVLMCVPADFNDAQRRASLDVVLNAGYTPIGTVNEPTAAIVAYGKGKDGAFVVVDIGGGTTDVSIVRVENGCEFTVLGTAGRDDRGGREFTSAIVDSCVDYARQHGITLDPEEDARDIILLDSECENAKIDVTTRESTTITFRAKDKLFDVPLTRATFESLVAPVCEDIFALFTEAMTQTGLQPDQIDGLVFAGGGSRVHCARARIEAFVGLDKVRKDIDVDKAIVMGAVDLIGAKIEERAAAGNLAIKAQVEEYQLKADVNVRDVLGQALGIHAIDKRTGRELMAPIIEQGAPLPAKATRLFGLVMLQEGLPGTANIVVLQGKALSDAKDCQALQSFVLDKVPDGPMDERVRVTFAVDTNGLVDVHAIDTLSGSEIAGQVDARGAIAQRQLG
ncbi:MAG: Hsp70 family protein [Candidatus Hydrogenedentes bacterium]|nr:Hsp70 family protein [Candidatus Hydrogenedentota bacterium]